MDFLKQITWKRTKEILKKVLFLFINPRLLLCLLIAWMITNGWSYIFIAVGGYFSIDWMFWLGTAYGGFLWFPLTPEKIITVVVAIFLLRLFFPKDEKTLGVLREMLRAAKEKLREGASRRKERREMRKKRRAARMETKNNHNDNE